MEDVKTADGSEQAAQTTPSGPDLQTPGWRERWCHAAGLFFFFTLIALSFRIIQTFEEMYKEAGMGDTLPVPTQCLVAIRHWALYAFGPAMFIISWVFFSWAAKQRRRLLNFSAILFLLALAGGGIAAVMLFLPLIGTMRKIGI